MKTSFRKIHQILEISHSSSKNQRWQNWDFLFALKGVSIACHHKDTYYSWPLNPKIAYRIRQVTCTPCKLILKKSDGCSWFEFAGARISTTVLFIWGDAFSKKAERVFQNEFAGGISNLTKTVIVSSVWNNDLSAKYCFLCTDCEFGINSILTWTYSTLEKDSHAFKWSEYLWAVVEGVLQIFLQQFFKASIISSNHVIWPLNIDFMIFLAQKIILHTLVIVRNWKLLKKIGCAFSQKGPN